MSDREAELERGDDAYTLALATRLQAWLQVDRVAHPAEEALRAPAEMTVLVAQAASHVAEGARSLEHAMEGAVVLAQEMVNFVLRDYRRGVARRGLH